MLQEYPTQIQPRSSSTRETQDVIELQDSSNKVDAEASRILIDLANQDTSLLQSSLTSTALQSGGLMTIVDNKFKQRTPSKRVSLPIKTDVNIHLQKEEQHNRRPDPIMLLAAAAAVIDDEGNKYKGRSYERREIRLHGRHNSAKRKSYTYGEEMEGKTSLLHRRYSERRHRYGRRPSVSLTATPQYNCTEEEEEEAKGSESQSEGTHAFSWQYLSMKQNPRIKRNAMHAYITYMIYTDMAQEQRGVVQQRPPHPNKYIEGVESNRKEVLYSGNTTFNSNTTTATTDWYTATATTTTTATANQQSYRLPPSPRQRHDPPTTESIIGRPLTDFLFEGKKNSNNLLPLPNSSNTTATPSSTTTTNGRLPSFL